MVDARTRMAGAGRLQMTVRLPLLAPQLTLSYKGRFGSMDARAFNTALVGMAGMRIQGGDIEGLWFDTDIQAGNATGLVQGIYRSLEVEVLGEGFVGVGAASRMKTFAANRLISRVEKHPGRWVFAHRHDRPRARRTPGVL